jgi:hypothetical protein
MNLRVLPLERISVLVRASLALSIIAVAQFVPQAGAQTPTATPIPIPSSDLPQPIPTTAFSIGATTNFSDPPFVDVTSLAVDAIITNFRPQDMKVFVFTGSDPSSSLSIQYVLWDHEKLLDANKQPVTNITIRAILPPEFADFLNNTSADDDRTISVRVVDDTPGSFGGNDTVGVFTDCTLIINPSINPNNHSPPSVQLFVNDQPDTDPSVSNILVNYGDPLKLAATAVANPSSSFTIDRLGIKITKLVLDPDPILCAEEGDCGDASGVGPQWDAVNDQAAFRRSFEVRQNSISDGSAALVYTAPELPTLPPGKYAVEVMAIDSAGFSTQSLDYLIVTRRFGFFNIAYLDITDNGQDTPDTLDDDTRNVTAKLRLENRMPVETGISSNLRVQLIARPLPVFIQADGQPAIPEIMSLAEYDFGQLPPGSHNDITISALVPAPNSILTGFGGGIQWEVDAILLEELSDKFVPVDSLLVLKGVAPDAFRFGGPGDAKLNPDPGVDAEHTTKSLSFVEVKATDPLTVYSGSQIQYHLTAVIQPFQSSVEDSADVTSSPATAWKLNGQSLPGGLLTAPNVSQPTPLQLSGSYSFGSFTKTVDQPITVIPNTSLLPVSPLANISTRLQVGNASNDWGNVGFIINGTAPKKVLIRALGPTLANYAVPGALRDPVLYLVNQQTGGYIAGNDDWVATNIGGQITEERATQLESPVLFNGTIISLNPPDTLESAMIVTLNPGQNYSAIVRGWNGASGIALVEVYDLNESSSSRITNLSTRGIVGTGASILDGGLIVAEGPTKVIVRALGPTLANFGVANALLDPRVTLFNVNGVALASNDNWKNTQQSEISATGYAPPSDLESAILVVLSAGNYTAVVQGNNNSTGIGLVEFYNLDE